MVLNLSQVSLFLVHWDYLGTVHPFEFLPGDSSAILGLTLYVNIKAKCGCYHFHILSSSALCWHRKSFLDPNTGVFTLDHFSLSILTTYQIHLEGISATSNALQGAPSVPPPQRSSSSVTHSIPSVLSTAHSIFP